MLDVGFAWSVNYQQCQNSTAMMTALCGMQAGSLSSRTGQSDLTSTICKDVR